MEGRLLVFFIPFTFNFVPYEDGNGNVWSERESVVSMKKCFKYAILS